MLPIFSWDTGTQDADGNEIYTSIDFNALAVSCGSTLIGGQLLELWGRIYQAGGAVQPFMFQALTNDLPGLKAAINTYISNLNPPSGWNPIYIFSIDVTLAP